MTAKQSEERPENVNTGNWRQLVRDVVDENPEVFIPNDKPTAMNTQSPQTTLSEERLRAQFEEWANREMKGGIRRLESGKYALDSINGAWIAWQHAAEQMAKVVEANNKLRWALESQPCTCLDGDPCVRCVGLSEWKVDLPPAPEKGGSV